MVYGTACYQFVLPVIPGDAKTRRLGGETMPKDILDNSLGTRTSIHALRTEFEEPDANTLKCRKLGRDH